MALICCQHVSTERKPNQPALHITTADGWMKALLPLEEFAMYKTAAATIWPLYQWILSQTKGRNAHKTYAGRTNSLTHRLSCVHYTVNEMGRCKKKGFCPGPLRTCSIFDPLTILTKSVLLSVICFSGPWLCCLQTKFPLSRNKILTNHWPLTPKGRYSCMQSNHSSTIWSFCSVLVRH